MALAAGRNRFSRMLKERRHRFDADEILHLFQQVDEERVEELAGRLVGYISVNLPAAFEKRDGLSDYRTNPYVLMTAASVMNLGEPAQFGKFLFDSKLYMALETSFGKQIEAAFVGRYPLQAEHRWTDAPEKVAEFGALEGLDRETRAQRRIQSVWREIDRSCVVGNRRFLTSIKSGPNTINDTQVAGMTAAIRDNYRAWFQQTHQTYPSVNELDVVLGLTYGTDKTTNNKENQILIKLMDCGFVEEDPVKKPGILIDEETRSIRVYRCIGREFWSFIGQPDNPGAAQFVFLEVLLALAKALGSGIAEAGIEGRINLKLQALALSLAQLQFPRNSLPEWVREDFNENQLFWFATAMTAFFDEGI
ncbi:PmeII family type II restriction endonuclease [Sphingomonas sp.]|uniref:PmeII family type II restriction endonuclease n=1 Tax=Sphingomonas sp. TaxID=28214 RepID=UPI0038AC4D1C